MSHTHNTFAAFSWHTPRMPFWRASIILTGVLVAMALTFSALTSGLLLLVLSAFVAGVVTYRAIGRPGETHWQGSVPGTKPEVIEGEFVVISDELAGAKTPPADEEPRRK